MNEAESYVFEQIARSDARIRQISWDTIRDMPYRARTTIEATRAMKAYARDGGGWIKYDAVGWGSDRTAAGSQRVCRAVRSLAAKGLIETTTENGRTTSHIRLTNAGRNELAEMQTSETE